MSAVKIDKSWVAGFATVAVLFAGGCTAIAQPSSESATDPEPGPSGTTQVTANKRLVSLPSILWSPTGRWPDWRPCRSVSGHPRTVTTIAVRPGLDRQRHDRGGHNGCDTRNDILKRDLIYITTDPMSRDCTVLSGTLDDVYTGKTIRFVRGVETSSAVQIDHVVALSERGRRAHSNSTRPPGATSPTIRATCRPWTGHQPGEERRRCLGVAAAEPRLPVHVRDPPDRGQGGVRVVGDAGRARRDGSELASCGATESADPAPIPVPEPADVSPAGAGMPSGDVYYANCKAARTAGAAPLHRGQPGYRAAMDSDGDGVACE